MTEHDKLLPCPFCGATDIETVAPNAIYGTDKVRCNQCNVALPIKTWNRRASAKKDGWVSVPRERLMLLVDWLHREQDNLTCASLCDKTWEAQGCPSGTCALQDGKDELNWWTKTLAAAPESAAPNTDTANSHPVTDQCGFDRNASISEDRYVCECGWRSETSRTEDHAAIFGPERQDYPGGPVYRVGTSTGVAMPDQPNTDDDNSSRYHEWAAGRGFSLSAPNAMPFARAASEMPEKPIWFDPTGIRSSWQSHRYFVMACDYDALRAHAEAQQREIAKQHEIFIEDQRERLAALMIEHSFATGHGDTMESLFKELEWQLKERTAKLAAATAKANTLRDRLAAAEAELREVAKDDCPRPILDDPSIRACLAAGKCGCYWMTSDAMKAALAAKERGDD